MSLWARLTLATVLARTKLNDDNKICFQGRSKLDNWGGGADQFIYSCSHTIIKGLKETTHGYKKERNKANDFTCKLQYDVSIFFNRRQSDFTKCSLMISQREIMISRLVLLESSYSGSTQSSRQSVF